MDAYVPDSLDRKRAVVEFFAKCGQQFLPLLGSQIVFQVCRALRQVEVARDWAFAGIAG